MIYFDVTKTGAAGHRSGLMRVSTRLRDGLGAAATEVVWADGTLKRASSPAQPLALRADDWVFTSELFSEEERPGFTAFLAARPCRFAAVFHDAIPLKYPHITWPKSVARHPAYMKLLSRFDRVWAVSQASREELLGFWQWQGAENLPPVDVLALGADFDHQPPATKATGLAARSTRPSLLCIGIVEPRKNQSFLLDVCDALWRGGLDFELHLVGRVNPHFGAPIVANIKSLRRVHGARLQFHEAASDALVSQLYSNARASAFPTIAEGCGLPLLESLRLGVPCVHSDLPVLRENAAGGGCLAAALNDPAAWQSALRAILTDDALHARLAAEARARVLPTWADAAKQLIAVLR
ncbi:MAG: glycosyltransferase [Verrucomicrobiota bacterium]